MEKNPETYISQQAESKAQLPSPATEVVIDHRNDERHDNRSLRSRVLDIVFWTPPWCRRKEFDEPKLSLGLTVLYAFTAGFSAANLYYSHPILEVMALEFHTTQTSVANVPTLAQAGEATCLLLILPLADFVPRRAFTLTATLLAALLW